MTEEQLANLIAEHVTIVYELGEGGKVDPDTIGVTALGAAHVVMRRLAVPDMLAVLQWIADQYENQNLNHVDFRVEAKRRADEAIAKATKP